jgi:hypothetical protein
MESIAPETYNRSQEVRLRELTFLEPETSRSAIIFQQGLSGAFSLVFGTIVLPLGLEYGFMDRLGRALHALESCRTAMSGRSLN